MAIKPSKQVRVGGVFIAAGLFLLVLGAICLCDAGSVVFGVPGAVFLGAGLIAHRRESRS